MNCKVAIMWMACLSGCTVPAGSTYRTGAVVAESSSLIPEAEVAVGALGALEVPALLGILIKREIVVGYPAADLQGPPLVCGRETRVKDVVRAVEVRMGWIYDPARKRFYRAIPTHSIDQPDSFGRIGNLTNPAELEPRPVLALAFRLIKRSAGLSGQLGDVNTAGVNGAKEYRVVTVAAIDGVQLDWADSSSHSYYNGVVDPSNGSANRLVNTDLRTVSAGVSIHCIAARMPGDLFRIDGQLTLSAFNGQGIGGQDTITVPLQMDGPRHRWLRLFCSEGNDGAFKATLTKSEGSASVGADCIWVEVRAD